MAEAETPIPAGPNFLGSDWSGFAQTIDEDERRREEAREAMEKIDAACVATFRRSRSGKIVWEWLWKNTILAPTLYSHLGVDQATTMMFYREGQNALIHEIHNRIERSLRDG